MGFKLSDRIQHTTEDYYADKPNFSYADVKEFIRLLKKRILELSEDRRCTDYEPTEKVLRNDIIDIIDVLTGDLKWPLKP